MVSEKCYLEDCSECYYDNTHEVYKCRVYSDMEVDEDTVCGEEEDKMKRLDIRKGYMDDKIYIDSKKDENDYAIMSATNLGRYKTATIRIGENYLTIRQVNAMLKAMELPYELYESLDWNKVEEGADVLVLDKKGIIDGYRGKFVKYIADIKKIVVRAGDEVYVVDEDKVELN